MNSNTENEVAPLFDVQDIVNAMGLLDIAADAGAFKGWEMMEKALNTRLRLQRFAESIIATTQTAAEPAPTVNVTE